MPTGGGLDISAEAAVAACAEVLGVVLPPGVLAFSDLHLLWLVVIRYRSLRILRFGLIVGCYIDQGICLMRHVRLIG